MSARTEEEKRAVAHIRGKSPKNVGRRNQIVRAMRESQERIRNAQLENPEYRASLNRKQTIFDEFYHDKTHKELESTPDNRGNPAGEDCRFCIQFRLVDLSVCPNCGKPLGK